MSAFPDAHTLFATAVAADAARRAKYAAEFRTRVLAAIQRPAYWNKEGFCERVRYDVDSLDERALDGIIKDLTAANFSVECEVAELMWADGTAIPSQSLVIKYRKPAPAAADVAAASSASSPATK